jgi:outer membrane protein assembly factor BamD
MMMRMTALRFLLLPVLAATLVACAGNPGPKLPPEGSSEPDKFLFDRGNEEMAKKNWVTAREYFRNLVDRYPQSGLRPDAKLSIGDTYLQENSAESRVLATNEYQEFLSYFPTNPRADYAMFKIAEAHFNQMLAPERDQTETREAIAQYEAFLTRFPNSDIRPEAEAHLRAAKDRLADAEFNVGRFYARIHWCPGAIDRLQDLLKSDPNYTNRDGVYYYLAECFFETKQSAQALPYYDRIVQEFAESEYLKKAKERIAEIKSGATSRY